MSATHTVRPGAAAGAADTEDADGAGAGAAPGRAGTVLFAPKRGKPAARGWWTSRRLAMALAPALVYLGIREVGVLVLALMGARNKVRIGDAVTAWDGQWYLGIASGGYDGVPAGLVDAYGRRSAETPLAFFPGYPASIRWVAEIGGFSLVTAGLLVSGAAGVCCAYALARIGRLVTGGSTVAGLALVALFAASPMGIVLSMVYSEALFCALAAWALVGVLERKWLLAGLCCTVAGFVRPTAAALVLTVGLAALVAVARRRDGWRPVLAGLLAPVGLLAYLGWVATRTGELGGYFALQARGWDSKFDGGRATLKFTVETLTEGRSVLEVGTVALIVVAVALVAIGFAMRVEWPLMVYGLAALLMDIGSNGMMNSKARLLVPAFTLLVPVAIALAKRRRTTMVLVLAAVAVASAWFGAYSLTIWQYAI